MNVTAYLFWLNDSRWFRFVFFSVLNWNPKLFICYFLSDLFWCVIRTLCSLGVFAKTKYVLCRAEKLKDEKKKNFNGFTLCVYGARGDSLYQQVTRVHRKIRFVILSLRSLHTFSISWYFGLFFSFDFFFCSRSSTIHDNVTVTK